MLKRAALVTLALASLLVTGLSLQVSTVVAAPKDEICAGIGETSGGSCGSGAELTNVVRSIVNIFSIVIGITAVVMIMVGGFKFITAAGDSNKVTSAKHTLTYALIGLVVVAMSQFIVQFVLEKAK